MLLVRRRLPLVEREPRHAVPHVEHRKSAPAPRRSTPPRLAVAAAVLERLERPDAVHMVASDLFFGALLAQEHSRRPSFCVGLWSIPPLHT